MEEGFTELSSKCSLLDNLKTCKDPFIQQNKAEPFFGSACWISAKYMT